MHQLQELVRLHREGRGAVETARHFLDAGIKSALEIYDQWARVDSSRAALAELAVLDGVREAMVAAFGQQAGQFG